MSGGLAASVTGLTEPEFLERFGSEEQCVAFLIRMRWSRGFVCERCGHSGYARMKCRRQVQCNRCKQQTGFTAGTVFQGTKLPLTVWFLAIYHLSRSKGGISSVELGRRLGVRQATAWLMKQKLMRAMLERDAGKPPMSGQVEINDAYLGGVRSGGKRGRCAGGKTPFVEVVETTAERRPRQHKLTPVKGFREKEIETLAKASFAPCTNIVSYGLSCWQAVTKVGCDQFPLRTGSGRQAAKWPSFQLGQHHTRQHQDRARRHLPSRQQEARPALPRQLRLALQLPLPPRHHDRAPDVGRAAAQAPTLPRRHWIRIADSRQTSRAYSTKSLLFQAM